ncbi:hypothetical protein ACH47B_32395 [Rhodococcus sp. NPDC019627]|uniref:hypothetical protein n=1 Tax=unclassified Rhodococcus (in: high G+C Gram-positive bacteria) TaxID=192944 RepID=UPI0034005B2D
MLRGAAWTLRGEGGYHSRGAPAAESTHEQGDRRVDLAVRERLGDHAGRVP